MTRGQWITGLIFAAIIAVAVAGLFSGKADKSVYDEKEREVHLEMIRRNSDSVAYLRLRLLTIEAKMDRDSLKHIDDLRAKDEAILRHKRNNEKVNLSNADTRELDSVRAAIRNALSEY
jgi:hypothetical protein